MGLIKIGNTTLNKGAKGDMPSFFINGNLVEDGENVTITGSGSASTYDFIITSENDLYNPANEGKVGVLTTDIALTADRTLANRLTLKGEGGKITGSFILTGNNTNFSSIYKDNIIISDEVDLRGTFDLQNPIWLKWFGAQRDSESLLYDNLRAIHNALRVVNYQGGTLIVNNGLFYVSIARRNDQFGTFNSGITYDEICLRTNVKLKGESLQAELKVLNSGTIDSYALLFAVGDFVEIDGLTLTGDRDVKETTGEGCAMIKLNIGRYGTIKNCIIQKAPGDGIETMYITGMREDYLQNWVLGDLDSTANEVSSTTTWRSGLYNLPNSDSGYLTGGSYGSYGGVVSRSAIVYYYDSLGNFIGKTGRIAWYKPLQFPENATQARVVVPKNMSSENILGQIQIRDIKGPDNWTIKNNVIRWNWRNGISNLFQGSKVVHNYIFQNGGIPAGPGYGIDFEDGFQLLNDLTVEGNVFEDNWVGSITIPWGFNVKILNNTFNGYTSARAGTNPISSLNTRYADEILLEGNQIFNTVVELGRRGMFKNNYVYESSVRIANIYGSVKDNVFYNSNLGQSVDSIDAPGRSLSESNVFIFDRQFNQAVVLYNTDKITSLNDEVYFDWGAGVNSIHIDGLQSTPRDTSYPTSKTNFKINLKEGSIGFQFPTMDGLNAKYESLYNCTYNTAIRFGGGQDNDIELVNNNFFGWINFGNIFNSKTAQRKVVVKRGKIDTNNTYTSNNSYPILRSQALTIDLEFYEVDILNNGNASNYSSFAHSGTVLFNGCDFSNPTQRTWDLNANTCGEITFIDCDFNNTNVTLRAGDKILYTKPHPNAPTYADNATALAALGEGYYYKLPTGEFSVTYTAV